MIEPYETLVLICKMGLKISVPSPTLHCCVRTYKAVVLITLGGFAQKAKMPVPQALGLVDQAPGGWNVLNYPAGPRASSFAVCATGWTHLGSTEQASLSPLGVDTSFGKKG